MAYNDPFVSVSKFNVSSKSDIVVFNVFDTFANDVFVVVNKREVSYRLLSVFHAVVLKFNILIL